VLSFGLCRKFAFFPRFFSVKKTRGPAFSRFAL